MERRVSLRAQVDVPICALVDGHRHECRAVDLSPAGMVFERSRALAARDMPMVSAFEIYLGQKRPVRARGRAVWERGLLFAVKFVVVSDVDRLTLAELLDEQVRKRRVLH